jgi:UDP-N-acetyl-D-mannosaminuronic acid dehydrogenase
VVSSDTEQVTWLYENEGPADHQREAFLSGQVPVAVYGLGKMGLPLAAVFADVTGNVVGVDIDDSVVERLNRGQSTVDREPGLDDLVADLVADGDFRAVTDVKRAASDATIHVVIVPTGVNDDGTLDLGALRTVLCDVGDGLSPGDTVFVECTVPPGTCTKLVEPILTSVSGLDPGDFGVAFCPERTASGRALQDIRGAYPKIVGGVNAESTRVATLVYETLNASGVVTVSDATTAEAVKVFEGVYRDVNIALANELATYTDTLGIDVREAIDAANTQPYSHIHTPGPGVGGHCIPFYPYFLTTPFDVDAQLIRTARRINDGMPVYTVQRLQDCLEAVGRDISESSVLVLGVTYRAGVKETTESPAMGIIDGLRTLGASVYASDPMLDDIEQFGAQSVPVAAIHEAPVDAVILVTDHEEFAAIDWARFDRRLVIVDGRDALELPETDHYVYTIGSG